MQPIRALEETRKATSKFLLKNFKIFDENFGALFLRKPEVYWKKPTIVGACVIELAKFHLFNFQ